VVPILPKQAASARKAAAAHWPPSLESTSDDIRRGGHGMPNFDELTWKEAMRRGHAALIESERLYDDINVEDGRSNTISKSTCGDPK
jgi:hypothetical protein